MVRTVTLAAALLIGPGTALAQTYTFVDIPDAMAADQVQDIVASHGFTFDQRDEDGDYWFTGELMGWDAQLLAFMTPESTVAKIIVRLMTPDDDALSAYENLRGVLIDKYGEPHTTLREFESPYEEGDGREQDAVKLGKATIATLWVDEDEDGSLRMDVSQQLTVDLSYDYPSWTAELARRRRKAAQGIF